MIDAKSGSEEHRTITPEKIEQIDKNTRKTTLWQ